MQRAEEPQARLSTKGAVRKGGLPSRASCWGQPGEEPAPSSASLHLGFRSRIAEPSQCVIWMMAKSVGSAPSLTNRSLELETWPLCASFLKGALGQQAAVGVRGSASWRGSISIASAPRVTFCYCSWPHPGTLALGTAMFLCLLSGSLVPPDTMVHAFHPSQPQQSGC